MIIIILSLIFKYYYNSIIELNLVTYLIINNNFVISNANGKNLWRIEKEEKLTDEKHNEGHIPMMIAAMNGHSKTI